MCVSCLSGTELQRCIQYVCLHIIQTGAHHAHTNIHTYKHIHTHAYARAYTHTYTHMHNQTNTHTHVYAHICALTQQIHTHTLNSCISLLPLSFFQKLFSLHQWYLFEPSTRGHCSKGKPAKKIERATGYDFTGQFDLQ